MHSTRILKLAQLAVSNVLNQMCDFPTMTSQNVCCEKHLLN